MGGIDIRPKLPAAAPKAETTVSPADTSAKTEEQLSTTSVESEKKHTAKTAEAPAEKLITGDLQESVQEEVAAILGNSDWSEDKKAEEIQILIDKTRDQVVSNLVLNTVARITGIGALLLAGMSVASPKIREMATWIRDNLPPEMMKKVEQSVAAEIHDQAETVYAEKRAAVDTRPMQVVQQTITERHEVVVQNGRVVQETIARKCETVVARAEAQGLAGAGEARQRHNQIERYVSVAEATLHKGDFEAVTGVLRQSQSLTYPLSAQHSEEVDRLFPEIQEKSASASEIRDETLEFTRREMPEKLKQAAMRAKIELTPAQCERISKGVWETISPRILRGEKVSCKTCDQLIVDQAAEVQPMTQTERERFAIVVTQEISPELVKRTDKLAGVVVELQALIDRFFEIQFLSLFLFVQNLIAEEQQKSHERQQKADKDHAELERDELKRDIARGEIRRQINQSDLRQAERKRDELEVRDVVHKEDQVQHLAFVERVEDRQDYFENKDIRQTRLSQEENLEKARQQTLRDLGMIPHGNKLS